MKWLNTIVTEIIAQKPEGEVIVESGISPSGSYHMGYLREIIICDAVVLALRARGRDAKHIHFVDDLDGFRKVPANLPEEYSQYLGKPLCDMPAPDGSDVSYADYCLQDFLDNVAKLGVEIEVHRSHEKYRSGFFTKTIEQTLEKVGEVRAILEEVSGRKLDEQWSPIQVNEDGYLKKRPFSGIDIEKKLITYLNKDNQEQETAYDAGQVKLDWRLDWPARWALIGVDVEPFGRDHATKGGSYDTGKALVEKIFGGYAPLPIGYNFVNRAGDTKKMSASKGNGILMSEVTAVLPAEVARFFILRSPPANALFFDPEGGVVRLIDEFAELLANEDKTEEDKKLLDLCLNNLPKTTVSPVPFSHLVASYQAALKDDDKTLEILKRTEYEAITEQNSQMIKDELHYIDQWLKTWAPDDVKFELVDSVAAEQFSEAQKSYMSQLATMIESAPTDASGEWFHKAVYEFKDKTDLQSKELFITLYQVLIGKDAGPRVGWFLSMLPRDWLVNRLRLEA